MRDAANTFQDKDGLGPIGGVVNIERAPPFIQFWPINNGDDCDKWLWDVVDQTKAYVGDKASRKRDAEILFE